MSSDVADLFWFESTDVDLSAVARELAELAEDHVVRAYIHRRGFKAAAIYVSTEDPMAAPSLAQSCASALAKVAGCRTWYFAALGGTSSFLSVDALDAKGKVRWSAYSDEEMPPAKLRPLAKRLGLTVDEDIHGANFPYWKMVEDAGLPVAQHLSLGIVPVLSFESDGWESVDDFEDLLPGRKAQKESSWQQWKNEGDRQAGQLRKLLLELRKQAGRETIYAVAVNSEGHLAANSLEALKKGLRSVVPWLSGDLRVAAMRWAPTRWRYQLKGKKTDSLHTEAKARACAEVFGKAAALYWNHPRENAFELLPDSHHLPKLAPPKESEPECQAALRKATEKLLLDAAEDVFCGPRSRLKPLGDLSDIEGALENEIRRRIPEIVPALLRRAEKLGRRGARLRTVIDPEEVKYFLMLQDVPPKKRLKLLTVLREALGED